MENNSELQKIIQKASGLCNFESKKSKHCFTWINQSKASNERIMQIFPGVSELIADLLHSFLPFRTNSLTVYVKSSLLFSLSVYSEEAGTTRMHV